jgi:[acyl-carrier-protein] S-malonyltransferase
MLVVVTPVLMFPGESSSHPVMIERALSTAPADVNLVREASEILGRDLLAHYRADNPAIFATQRDVQVGVFLANHLHLRHLEPRNIRAELSLGLGVGEYNHLVHIGALGFADAVRLVDARGRACEAGPDGAMVAVFPLELSRLESVVGRAKAYGTLEIGIYYSAALYVLSGERSALDVAGRMLDAEFRAETALVDPSLPMHSARFWPVVPAFLPALQQVPWQPIKRPYLPNAAGRFMSAPTPGDLIYSLTLQLWRPARWRQSLEFLTQRYPDATLIEVGSTGVSLTERIADRLVQGERLAGGPRRRELRLVEVGT